MKLTAQLFKAELSPPMMDAKQAFQVETLGLAYRMMYLDHCPNEQPTKTDYRFLLDWNFLRYG